MEDEDGRVLLVQLRNKKCRTETETNINIWHAYKIHKIHTLSVCVIYSLKQTATCFRVFFSASTSVFLRQVDGLLVGFPE